MAEYIERTEELILAMNAGARAIENTKRYHGAVYTKDVFSESPQEIPYLQAAKVLREVSDAPAADVAPVVHGLWMPIRESEMTGWDPAVAGRDPIGGYICSVCKEEAVYDCNDEFVLSKYCPNCGAKMDGGDMEYAELLPTVDAVPVVRCHGCINAEPLERNCEVNANFYMHCRLWRGEERKNVWHKYKRYYRDYSLVQHDDFCSSGERKDGAEC